MMKVWSVRSLALFIPLIAVAGVAQACLDAVEVPQADNPSGLESSSVDKRSRNAAAIAAGSQASAVARAASSPATASTQTPPIAQATPATPVPPPITPTPPTPPTPPTSPTPVPAPTAPEPEEPAQPPAGTPALRRLSDVPASMGLDQQLFGTNGFAADREALLQSIDFSLVYIDSAKAAEDYAAYPIEGVTRDRVRRSLRHFRQLVQASSTAQALQKAVQSDFDWYQATGTDGQGTVHFTGYFEPTYTASAVKTADYQYPLYQQPPDLDSWSEPHPDRIVLEGKDGLQAAAGPLKGLELVWLKSRLEAFLVQVQGSAKLQLTDGSTMSVGYAGRTNYPYVSVGRELVNDGLFSIDELSLPLMLDYFEKNPPALSKYLPRNPRFVFFKQTNGAPPTGSLSQPVTADRSIATDKSLMPPGALSLLHTPIPFENRGAVIQSRRYTKRAVSRYVLDQDTGGAIKGAGRADIFLGSGSVAGDRAGLVNEVGQLYYLLIKDGR